MCAAAQEKGTPGCVYNATAASTSFSTLDGPATEAKVAVAAAYARRTAALASLGIASVSA